MSSELLNALENRVTAAVGTIEELRAEVKGLKEERQILENKLRELLLKIERVDNGTQASPAEAGTPMPTPSAGYGSSGDY
jgi:FtsZ-binding cell division protein ZapB